MSNKSPLEQACVDESIAIADVEAILELYNSDEDEEIILEKLEAYPEAARVLVAKLIVPML